MRSISELCAMMGSGEGARATISDLCAVIRKTAPDHPFGIDENPTRLVPIKRTFWRRVWAAIRNYPTVEERRMIGVVRVVMLGNNVPLNELRAAVDMVRPACVVIEFECRRTCGLEERA